VKKALGVIATFWALFVSGCGTLFNVGSGDFIPYGGVARDLTTIFSAHQTPITNGTGGGKGAALALLVLLPTEVTLSFVGDTLTLPLMLYLHPIATDYDPVDGHDDEDRAKLSMQPQEQVPPRQNMPESAGTTTPVDRQEPESPKE
jgi:hypothetical protein